MSHAGFQEVEQRLTKLPKEFQIETLSVSGYERVISCNHLSGFFAIVSIHSLDLGPSLGGIRVFPYASPQEALSDALRLSKAMTYKAAVAGVGIGGGKSVIMVKDPKAVPNLFENFGTFVHAFQGRYIAAKDVGVTESDLKNLQKSTPYVVGLSDEQSSGNPSYFTAWGVFSGIKSSLEFAYGSSSCKGIRIALQGLGSVGMLLAEFLFWSGAELIVSDLDPKKLSLAKQRFSAKVVSEKEILSTPCDIFCPCALGGVISAKTIASLKAKIVAGAANNVLSIEKDAEYLQQRGILYAPDFVINAGGLFNVVSELEEGGYSAKRARDQSAHIFHTLKAIYEIAEKNRTSTLQAAKSLADYRIQYKIGKRERNIPLT